MLALVLLRSLLWLSLVLPCCVGVVSSARAEEPSTGEAELARGGYAEARKLALEGIRSGSHAAADLVKPYRVLALASGHLDDADTATRAFTTLLALDPAYRLPAGLPAEVRSPYMNARGFWSDHVVRLSADAALQDDGSSLSIRVSDPAGVSARVRVRVRVTGHDRFVESVQPPSASLTIPVEGLAVAGGADYVLALLDEHGNRVWQAGSDALPLHLSVPAKSPAPPSAVSLSPGPARAEREAPFAPEGRGRRPYYVAGAVLLTVAAGAVAGGAVAHARREQLAAQWNRGDCQGTGTTRGMICDSENKGIQNMTHLAKALYGGGALALLSGAALFLFAPDGSDEGLEARGRPTAWRCGRGRFVVGMECSRDF